ncbi:MFS transporter [Nocardia sp. SYP-A9097]|uniref:MFS transporter n=1 Tax=Nocardia sp. SYP-A9097 TaxID=2663237 RepID=UPI00129AB0D3|nr:MFS transporter [Nocardia sp. SYP-A9097]MRH91769.1 MFS transporter [Nocardia sp. SYP-A9097]
MDKAARTRHPNVVLAALLIAVGAYTLMQTMIIPTLPILGAKLGTDRSTTAWLVTAFMLGAAVSTPVLGGLGDRYGHKRVLLAVLGVFLIGTLGAAATQDIWTLIALRAVEGASMATLPLAFAIIPRTMPPTRIPAAFGLTAAMLGAGSGLGLVAGGLIIEHASWRWTFGAEAIIIVVAIAMVAAFVPESTPQLAKRIDLAGAVLLGGAVVALLVALTEGPRWGWTSWGVAALFLLAIVLFALLTVVEAKVRDPLVDLKLLTHLPMLITNVAALLIGVVPFFFYVLLPQLLQTPSGLADYGHGLSVLQAGLALLPGSILVMVGGRTAPWLRGHLGARAPLVAAMALMAAGAALTAIWHANTTEVVVWFCVLGLGAGYGYAALAELVAAIVPHDELAAANGLNTTVRTIGSAVGGQLSIVLLQNSTGAHGLPAEHGYTSAFWLAAVLAAIGIVLAGALRVHPYSRGERDTAHAPEQQLVSDRSAALG